MALYSLFSRVYILTVMATTRLSVKGQVVIPQAIRGKLSLVPGDDLHIDLQNGRIVITKIVIEPPSKKTNVQYDDEDIALEKKILKGFKQPKLTKADVD